MSVQQPVFFPTLAHEYRFGRFSVSSVQRRVTRDGVALRIPQKSIDVLLALLANAGKPVSKQALIDAAWHDGIASDAALTKVIFVLRSALAEEAARLETVSQTGYRFAGPLEAVSSVNSEEEEAFENGGICEALGTDAGYRAALDFYTSAVRTKNDSVRALVGLGRMHMLLAHESCEEPWPHLEAARTASIRAHRIAPADPSAIALRVRTLAGADRTLNGARKLIEESRAVAWDSIDFRFATAQVALLQGHFDEISRMFRDPQFAQSRGASMVRAQMTYFQRGQFGIPQPVSRNPVEHYYLAAAHLTAGDVAKAWAMFGSIYRDEEPYDRMVFNAMRQRSLAMLVYCAVADGRRNDANRLTGDLMLAAQREYVTPFAFAIAVTALGNRDIAMRFIEDGVLRRDPAALYLKHDPILAQYKGDADFERILAAIYAR